jgi:hypothetical protein
MVGQCARLLQQVPTESRSPAEPVFERGGPEQAADDAGKDWREIGGGEGDGDEGEAGKKMRGGAVLAQRVGEVLPIPTGSPLARRDS